MRNGFSFDFHVAAFIHARVVARCDMDLLTDLLEQTGLQRRLLDPRRLPARTALRFPCDRSLGFHVVTAGQAWIHPPAPAEPIPLATGDVALMARGCLHVVAPSRVLDGCTIETAGASAMPSTTAGSTSSLAAADPARDPPVASLVSGAYQFWNPPLHPLFAELPTWFVLRAQEMPRLGPVALTVGLLCDEAGRDALGARTLLHGLLDVLLVQLLREIVARHGGAGWSRAVRDPQVARALAAMQADPARAWTLDGLAREAGLSRTALAERFREAMGTTPLAHLRTLRLQKAMRLLGEPQRKLEAVAREVGYLDAFGFSKAFKREVGESPAAFRRREAAERHHPGRLDAGLGT